MAPRCSTTSNQPILRMLFEASFTALRTASAKLSGEIALQDLSRLQPLLMEVAGVAEIDLDLGLDDEGYRSITGSIKARTIVQCQRCLGPVALDLAADVALAKEDSVERHFMDTIEGGAWLNNQELAWLLVSTAPTRIRELENDIGCFFDRNPDGTVHQKAFAGQTFDRTVHKGDLTGIEIINRLAEQVWARKIARLEEHRAVELIRTPDGSAIAGVLMIVPVERSRQIVIDLVTQALERR